MKLFEEFTIKGLKFRNRIGVSPMCQYSCEEGTPNDWHLVHLGSRAVGGAALVMTEAAAVEARGRISAGDAGIYSAEHAQAWQPVTRFIKSQGAVAGVQLAHAGRKASTDIPWKGGKPLSGDSPGGWSDVVGPSAIAFDKDFAVPHALSVAELGDIVKAFRESATLAQAAGFEVVEIHAAHGYLLHEFLSPLSNQRQDEYGGPFENRTRIVKEVVEAVKSVWPEKFPIFVRISATDWTAGGWDIEQSIELSKKFKAWGVDMVDCSSGGNVPHAKIPVGPNYQVPFSEQLRHNAKIATAAVGMITDAKQANEIITEGRADFIFLAREFLRDPYWPRRAAKELGEPLHVPNQYARSW